MKHLSYQQLQAQNAMLVERLRLTNEAAQALLVEVKKLRRPPWWKRLAFWRTWDKVEVHAP